MLCPYAGIRQNEQLLRAEILAAHGLAVLLREDHLTPDTLVEAIEGAMNLPPRAVSFDLDGAANTARLIKDFARRPAPPSIISE